MRSALAGFAWEYYEATATSEYVTLVKLYASSMLWFSLLRLSDVNRVLLEELLQRLITWWISDEASCNAWDKRLDIFSFWMEITSDSLNN